MTDEKDVEIHNVEIDGYKFRLTSDPWTGDWAVEDFGEDKDEDMVQPVYVRTKNGAIEYCLEKSGFKEYGGYKMAPDRTSA